MNGFEPVRSDIGWNGRCCKPPPEAGTGTHALLACSCQPATTLEKHTEHKHDRLPHPRKAHEEYKRHAPRVPTDCSQPRSGKVSQRTEDDPAHRGNTKPSGTPTPTPTPNPNPNPNPNSGQVPCEMAFVFRATPKQTGVLTHVEMLGLGLGLGSSLMSKAAAKRPRGIGQWADVF